MSVFMGDLYSGAYKPLPQQTRIFRIFILFFPLSIHMTYMAVIFPLYPQNNL